MTRLLQSTIRTLNGEPSEYLSDWVRVGEAAVAANARAWIFRAVDSDTTYIEFIEWKPLVSHERSLPARVTALLNRLERHGPGNTRQWQEPDDFPR